MPILGHGIDIVETDGFNDHGTRDAFKTDRRRDVHLFTTYGLVTLRFTYEDVVERPDYVESGRIGTPTGVQLHDQSSLERMRHADRDLPGQDVQRIGYIGEAAILGHPERVTVRHGPDEPPHDVPQQRVAGERSARHGAAVGGHFDRRRGRPPGAGVRFPGYLPHQ